MDKVEKQNIDISSVKDENQVFSSISYIIEKRKFNAVSSVNSQVILMFWEIGKYINLTILENVRADYGKKILSTVSTKLVAQYGKSFVEANLYRMKRFAIVFPEINTIADFTPFLSWSHFCEIMRIKDEQARLFYAQDAVERQLGIRELRQIIARKAYERTEIANMQLTPQSIVPFNVFKDPYLLDVFDLKDNFLESDIENAILLELEKFILEFGNGFAFMERQKRIIVDGDDFKIDLLFFHRTLRRLVAIELKTGRFMPKYKGQMELYLKWLDRYERKDGENSPIGLILCTEASRDQIELLEMDKAGIAVAEFWTNLPPKSDFEKLIKKILSEAKERIERKKYLENKISNKQVE
ncbi:MAG: PDDEXK nuclease domain-containing protein [Lentimicrobiaceae bacterium]|nr:PDDEXK nuclease domain-containing protein [Lentimicrobiaceae bacterium]